MTEDRFEAGQDPIDVTSMHRPDTGWVMVDAHGHEHRWHVDGRPAVSYSPSATYDVPTLVYVKDGEETDEDGETYEVGHLECRACGEHVRPGYTADTIRQYIPGLRWYRINGQSVSPEEFERRLTAAQGRPR
jgi:hypothetical protein